MCFNIGTHFKTGPQDQAKMQNQLKGAIIMVFCWFSFTNTYNNVKRVADSDEPAYKYLNLHLPLALWSFIVNFSSLFRCP